MCLRWRNSILKAHQSIARSLPILNHVVDLWLNHSTKWSVKNSLGKVGNMFWNSFAKEESCEIIREIVAVVRPQIIRLVIY